MGWFIGFVSIFGTKVGLEWFVYRTIQVASGRTDGLDLCSSGCFFHCLVTWRNRLNFSDEDLILSLSSSKFNLHLSFWPFFALSSVV